jgi:DNA-binding transcriptional ArsR family regulator
VYLKAYVVVNQPVKKIPKKSVEPAGHAFTYLTNHSHVLVALDLDPELRVRDLAAMVQVTERAVQRILSDLQDAGVLRVEKMGRRNRYRIARSARLRHPLEDHCTVGGLLDWVHAGGKGVLRTR